MVTYKSIISMRSFLLFTILILLSGCSAITVVKTKNMTAKSIKLKGDKRVSYFIYDAQAKKTYTLSEPPPDAILEKAAKMVSKVDVADKVNTTQEFELVTKAIELGERTVAVNILRDALFRLSEMNINNRNQPLDDGYRELFDSILTVTKTIALAQKAKEDKALAEAQIKLTEINLENDVLSNYQSAIRFIINQDQANALNFLEQLYKKYPSHFNISEIYNKLKTLSTGGMTDGKWKDLYKFILNGHKWRIDDGLITQLEEKVKN